MLSTRVTAVNIVGFIATIENLVIGLLQQIVNLLSAI